VKFLEETDSNHSELEVVNRLGGEFDRSTEKAEETQSEEVEGAKQGE